MILTTTTLLWQLSVFELAILKFKEVFLKFTLI